MESTVKELQKELEKYKKWDYNLNCFLKENNFKDEIYIINQEEKNDLYNDDIKICRVCS